MGTSLYRTICIVLLLTLSLRAPAISQDSGDFLFHPAERLENSSLRNARETPAGPILMGIYTEGNASPNRAATMVRELQALGVQAIIGFQPPDRDIRIAFEENFDYHYFNFHWWLGYDSPWFDTLLSMIQIYGPDHIAIHCQHGVDRAGNTMAFLLAVHYNVPIADAWYMMVANTNSQTRALAEVLEEFGIYDSRPPNGSNVNLYGINGNGMHLHTEGFKNYARETITRAIEYGATW